MVEKKEQVNNALAEIQKSMEKASVQRQKMVVLETKLGEERVQMEGRKTEIESKLSNIQPILDSAKLAVGSINSKDLVEIASFATPPQAIRDVLSGVLGLLGTQDTSWNSMKATLKAKGIKDSILGFDAKNITPDIRERVGKVLEDNANSFEEKVIMKVSKATAPLAAWVKANVQYSAVLESIAPLTNSLEKTKKSLESSEKKLNVIKFQITFLIFY